MSTTLASLANCGCQKSKNPIPAGALTIAPKGSIIVQAPCGESCAPGDSSNAPGLAAAPEGTVACSRFDNPHVLGNFIVPDIDKTGQFSALCASAWALPGLELFFPSLGKLVVNGASNDVVSYTNRSIERGTQILEGTRFRPSNPATANAVDEGESELASTTTLSALYGEDNGAKVKILPVDGMGLFACGGKWTRRQVGLMFYPQPFSLIHDTGRINFADKSVNVTLPGYPTKWDCGLGVYVVLTGEVQSWKNSDTQFPNVGLAFNGQHVGHASAGYKRGKVNTNMVMVPTTSATLTMNLIKRNTDPGDMQGLCWIHGYLY